MKFFFDFLPIVLFFVTYKILGIYAATVIAIAASLLQVIIFRLKNNRFEKVHVISFIIILVLGTATLVFHNPWFIKWKPTGIYWLMSLVFLLSPYMSAKPLVQRMMEANIKLPAKIWSRLNYGWAAFFVLMGSLNLYVAYFFSTDAWVNFKLFGGAGLTIVFVLVQALYLTRHSLDKELVSEPTRD